MNWANFINEVLEIMSLRQKKGCSPVLSGGDLDMTPRQADKPSPSSHWDLMELYKLMKQRWSYSKGYSVTLVANTNSMEPIIDDNSVVVYEDFKSPQGGDFKESVPIRVGDICLYEVDPSSWGGYGTILHQVASVRKRGEFGMEYKFRGVNNFFGDPEWVPESRVKGRAFLIANAMQPRVND